MATAHLLFDLDPIWVEMNLRSGLDLVSEVTDRIVSESAHEAANKSQI
jgi:hypothetical protein